MGYKNFWLRQRNNDKDNLGLTAFGSDGSWDVAIDETTSGTQQWFAEIEGPSVYLHFEIQSPHVIDKILEFLTKQSAQNTGEIAIGKSKEEPVVLVRDDEFPDRCFLLA